MLVDLYHLYVLFDIQERDSTVSSTKIDGLTLAQKGDDY